MRRSLNLKSLCVGAVVALFGVGIFLVANHPTTAARLGSNATPQNALPHTPAVIGIDSRATLAW